MSKKQKVFCIGLSRTGTVSICEALEILGYRTIHFSPAIFLNQNIIDSNLTFSSKQNLSFFKNLDFKREVKAYNHKFDKDILEKNDAFGDLPFPLFYKELDRKYPGSKFIYTFRDEEKWLKSMKWLYEEGAILWLHGYVDNEIKFAAYNSFKYDRQKLLRSYRSHHKDVKEYFKNRPNDILMLNIDAQKVTFNPLCEFLNEVRPEVAYPHSNAAKKASLKKQINYKLMRSIPLYSAVKNKMGF